MKKAIFLTFTFLFFLIFNAQSREIVIQYSKKGCFPGCGSVSITKMPCDWNGRPSTCVFMDCHGFGFSGCGSVISSGEGVSTFQATIGSDMLDYALNEIDSENNSGTYSHQYYNVDTGELSLFQVEWTKTGVLEEGTLDVEITVTEEILEEE